MEKSVQKLTFYKINNNQKHNVDLVKTTTANNINNKDNTTITTTTRARSHATHTFLMITQQTDTLTKYM